MQLRSKGMWLSSCSLVCIVDEQDSEELAMYEWNGTIIGPPHSAYENRIFSLSIYCGDKYPGMSHSISPDMYLYIDVPPLVKFESRINLPCVEATGLVRSLSLALYYHG